MRRQRQLGPARSVFWPAAGLVLAAVSASAQTSPPTVLPAQGELAARPGQIGSQIPGIPPSEVAPTPPPSTEATSTAASTPTTALTPPTEQPAPPELPPAIESTPAPQAWDGSVKLGFGWDENINASLVNGPSAWGGILSGNVSYLHYRPGSQVRLSAEGSGTAYESFDVYNRPNAAAWLDGRWRLSPGASMSLSAGYQYGHTDNSDWLVNQGLLYALRPMQTFNGSAELSWSIGTRTQLSVDARGVKTAFGSQDLQPQDLSATDSIRAWVALDREIGRHDGLGIESAWERMAQPEQRDSVFVSLQWRHELSPRTGFFLEGGVSQTNGAQPQELASSHNFYGGASVSRRVAGRSVVNAGYRREVVPAFGIGGVRLIDRVNVSFSTILGRWLEAGLGATYVIQADPVAAGSYKTADAEASVARRLGRNFHVSLAGRYRRSDSPDIALRDAYRIGTYLTWEPTAR